MFDSEFCKVEYLEKKNIVFPIEGEIDMFTKEFMKYFIV